MRHHWDCWECGDVMIEGEYLFKGSISNEYTKGLIHKIESEEFEVKTTGIKCSHCGYLTVAGKHMDALNIELADAYRMKHNLLTTKEIVDLRGYLKMNEQEFADYMQLELEVIKCWEHGIPQDSIYDLVLRREIEKCQSI